MKKLPRALALLVSLCFTALGWLEAQGLSSPFVDVVVLDVPLGTPKAIQDKNEKGLILHNTSDQPLRIHIDVVIPKPDQLRGNAEPIPDPHWVTVEPADLLIPARASAVCEMKVLIPREQKHRGRFYQAMIWTRARATNQKGVTVSVGLLSRLRLKTTTK